MPGNDLSEMHIEALRMSKFPVKKDVKDARLIKLASQRDLHTHSQWGMQLFFIRTTIVQRKGDALVAQIEREGLLIQSTHESTCAVRQTISQG